MAVGDNLGSCLMDDRHMGSAWPAGWDCIALVGVGEALSKLGGVGFNNWPPPRGGKAVCPCLY